MADYRDLYADFQAAGVEIAAVSVDDARRSEDVRQHLKLPFPILCDARRELVAAWGLLNTREHGGIAQTGTFVIDAGRRVRYQLLEGTATRAGAADLLEFLRTQGAPRKRFVWPGWRHIGRAFVTIFRYGIKSPPNKAKRHE